MSAQGELAASALEYAPFTVALLEPDGTIFWVNEAWRRFGRENGLSLDDDGVGADYLGVTESAVNDEDAQRAAAGLRAVLDGDEEMFSMVYPCHSPDERRWFRLHATLVGDSTADASPEPFCLVTHQNISDPIERARAETHQRERLERLASMLSHDLRGPLSVAAGWTAYLSKKEVYDPDVVAAIDRSLDRIDAIVEDAVTFIRAGIQTDETVTCSLAAVAREAWQTVETADATLNVVDDCVIRAHRGLLRNVFENLFRNSVEHGSTGPRSHTREDSVEHGSTSSRATPDDSVEHGSTGNRPEAGDSVEHGSSSADSAKSGVRIRVGPLDSVEGFYVEDDGPGIPPELRDQVFDLGFTTGDSTGFGLAIVDQLASLYGWHISVGESSFGSTPGVRFEVITTHTGPE